MTGKFFLPFQYIAFHYFFAIISLAIELLAKDISSKHRKIKRIKSVIISGQYSAEALNRKKSRPNVSYNSGSFNETDNANISSFGSLLAKATAEMKNIPDVRADVVADFKSRIESGTYNPPLDKLANVLYMAGMLEVAEE